MELKSETHTMTCPYCGSKDIGPDVMVNNGDLYCNSCCTGMLADEAVYEEPTPPVANKLYRRYGAAKKAANGREIIRVGENYIVGDWVSYDQISVIESCGTSRCHIGIGHLKRLRNANWAVDSLTHSRLRDALEKITKHGADADAMRAIAKAALEDDA